jgi:SAM-dependent methyltransferase
VKSGASTTDWGRKAARLYQPEYARLYREHDEELAIVDACGAYAAFGGWLRGICASFAQPIDVLDLGCGTGRYFSALANVRSIVGIDASPAMIAEARRPLRGDRVPASAITLVEGDFLAHDFGVDRFDLVYSIGVLAEHTPLDARIVAGAARWLRPGGRFAFTTVHVDSPSIPRTRGRSIGRAIVPWTAGAMRSRLRERLLCRGLYADEERIRELVEPSFTIESLTRMVSEAHLHALCVARKAA